MRCSSRDLARKVETRLEFSRKPLARYVSGVDRERDKEDDSLDLGASLPPMPQDGLVVVLTASCRLDEVGLPEQPEAPPAIIKRTGVAVECLTDRLLANGTVSTTHCTLQRHAIPRKRNPRQNAPLEVGAPAGASNLRSLSLMRGLLVPREVKTISRLASPDNWVGSDPLTDASRCHESRQESLSVRGRAPLRFRQRDGGAQAVRRPRIVV